MDTVPKIFTTYSIFKRGACHYAFTDRGMVKEAHAVISIPDITFYQMDGLDSEHLLGKDNLDIGHLIINFCFLNV